MASHDYRRSLNHHYGRAGIGEAILSGLRAAGKDLDALTPEDLAPADQFHTRGREATLELARLAGLERGMRVLDVGGGLCGPARTLATEIGCHVTVVDLTEEFCPGRHRADRPPPPGRSSRVPPRKRARPGTEPAGVDRYDGDLARVVPRAPGGHAPGGPAAPLGLHMLLGPGPCRPCSTTSSGISPRTASPSSKGSGEQGVTAPPR